MQHALARGLLDLSSVKGIQEIERAADRAVSDGRTSPERRVFLNDLLDIPQPLALRSRFDAMIEPIRNQGKIDVLVDLIRSRCIDGPVLIMLEDLHWANPTVIDSLAVLASSLVAENVVLMLTSRTEGDPLDPTWRTATREVPLVTIDLRPLRDEDALSLAREVSDWPEDLLYRCIDRAQGNPLFLEQLLRMDATRDANAAIPSSIRELALSRSDRLTARGRDALRAASILGQRFNIDALRHLLGQPGYECSELVAHDLVRPDRGEFLIAHALIREGIYASLLAETRRRLHLRAAEWFSETDSVLYANHLEAARDPEAPAAYAQAARDEFGAYRVERALQLVERGLDMATDTDRCGLLNLKGEILYHSGPVTESLAAYRATLAAGPDQGDRCRALVGIGMGLHTLDDYEAALVSLEEAEPIAEILADWEQLARIYITRANLAFSKGHTGKCLRYHERALEFARRAGSVELEAHALGGLGDAHYAAGCMRSAHEHVQRCIEVASNNGFGRIEAAHGIMIAGGTALYFLDLHPALAQSIEIAAFAAEVGSLRSQLLAHLSAATTAILLGELETADEHVGIAIALSRKMGGKRFEARCLCYLGRIRIAEGDRREACRVLSKGLSISLETAPGYCGPAILGTLARATDDPIRRRSALLQGESLLDKGAVGHNFIEFYSEAIEACIDGSDWEGALRYATLLEDYLGDEPLPLTDFVIARGRALVAFGQGDRGEALLTELRRLIQVASRHRLGPAIPALEAAASCFSDD